MKTALGPADTALQEQGLILCESASLRQAVREHLNDERVSPEERKRRLEEFLLEQEKYVGKRVYRPREPGRIGTAKYIHPRQTSFVGRIPGQEPTRHESIFDAYVRWTSKSGTSVPLSNLVIVVEIEAASEPKGSP